MQDNELSTLEFIKDLTLVWKNEAKDFTPWLSRNLDLLSDAIGTDSLELVGTEQDADSFRVDIVAEDAINQKRVIIENQLYDTDHDHLGKAITYAAWQDANVVVWVTRKARPAHRLAVKWLNEHTDCKISFFLIEIELWKIGDSAPAPRFNVIERPNEIIKEEVSVRKRELSPTGVTLMTFWTAFVSRASAYPTFASEFRIHKVYPGDCWYNLSVGNSRYYIDLVIRSQKKMAECGIYFSNCIDEYERFLEHRDSCLEIFPDLELCLSDKGQKDRRIFYKISADIGDTGSWPDVFDWYIDTALKLKRLIGEITKG